MFAISKRNVVFTLFTLLALCMRLYAVEEPKQKERPPKEKPQKQSVKKQSTPKESALKDPAELKPLKYRLIGPAWGGRVSRAAGIPGDPSTYYFAGAASGVWKSTDAGQTWKPIMDDQPISSIGSIAISPSDPIVIYVGSGEANIRGNVAAGNGIYKSVDAGKTWTHVWNQEGQIGTMVVHPTNPDIAFAAVLGHAFGPNPERGVYRTQDGGKTWQQVLKKDENTGASDVAIDPNNPNILFAGFWQARRYPWTMTSGGPGSGLYVSRDGGDTWKHLTEKGLPEGIWGKIGVAVAPSDSRRIYALIEAEQGGMFRSDDGGENWTRVSGSHLVRQRAWYYSTITVHPTNANEVWCPQVPMLKSVDGGETWQFVGGIPHGDNHDVWFDPKNPKRMISADDGGVALSMDGGESWWAPALPLGQFYHVSADTRVPFYIAGAMQDIGTAQGPSRSFNSRGIGNSEWYGVGGGEAGHVVSAPNDPNIVYAGEYLGYMSRYDHRTRQARNVSIYPEDASGHGAEDLRYRFQWTAPVATSPHDPKAVYHGANVLFRSEDGGQTWTAISPDLTRNDKSKQQWAGGPITGDNTGVEFYCTIFAIAESPVQKDLIWVGSDDGLVHVTRDGGKNWKNVTAAMPQIPEWGTISIIEPSHFDAGTAYVVVDAHRLDNMKPYLYRTVDFGESWKRLDGNLPQDIYLHSVREDPTNKDLLYVGTERGVVFSTDGGKTWRSLKLNMPTVAVHDLVVKDSSLVLATMGRSFYIFDHLSVLRELPKAGASKTVHVFSAPDAVRWQTHSAPRDRWTGDNPAGRALIYYWLKSPPKGDITIDVLDSTNNVVRSFSSKPKPIIGYDDDRKDEEEAAKKAALSKTEGIQMAPWDLTYSGSEMIENAKLDWGDPFVGPMVPPGTYTVRVSVDGQTESTTLKVLPDPRVQMSDADYKAQTEFGLKVRDEISRLTKLVRRIRSVRQQLAARNQLLQSDAKASQLKQDSEKMIGELNDLEARLHNPKAEVGYDILAMKGGAKLYSRMSAVFNFVLEGDGLPTQGVKELFADQKAELDRQETEANRVLSSELSSLNEAAKKIDVPTVFVP
jgi:photosystem II stability/assembly factor-like uncharacterized protein